MTAEQKIRKHPHNKQNNWKKYNIATIEQNDNTSIPVALHHHPVLYEIYEKKNLWKISSINLSPTSWDREDKWARVCPSPFQAIPEKSSVPKINLLTPKSCVFLCQQQPKAIVFYLNRRDVKYV